VALFPVAFFAVPRWVVPQGDFPAGATEAQRADSANKLYQRRNEVRTAGIQALGGMVLLFGSLWAYSTFRLGRDGHITERYEKAIELLGDGSMEVRLGAIFSLERIARLSRYDHGIVIEVLTAFLRSRTRDLKSGPRPRADIQAIITVLGRRNRGYDPSDYRLPLRDLYLVGATFDEGDLERADFSRAILSDASFNKANLVRATFDEAIMHGTKLPRARCKNATFSGAELDHAVTHGATDLDLGSAKSRPAVAA
jgi:hypothetical protein